MQRRVVVTGMGVVSALGPDLSAFRNALFAGRSGVAPLEQIPLDRLRFRDGAQARNFDASAHFSEKQVGMLDRFAQLALVAAREAVADANVPWTAELRARTAVITGSSLGGQSTLDERFLQLYGENAPRMHPLTVPRVMANAGASHISMEFGLGGPAYTVSSACASSAHAIGQAFWMIRSGQAEAAVTGGSEAPFSLGHLLAWDALRVVTRDACRPFARNRNGMILGECGAMLVLEPLDDALRRGATIYGEIVGFGMSADAQHLTHPSPTGAAAAIRAALDDAELNADGIGYINAHGTATAANDSMEAAAIHDVLGPHAADVCVSSTKAAHGHCLGGAGAIEAVATVCAMQEGVLPPTLNHTETDPECALDVVPNEARERRVDAALSHSFAFGGLNAVLAFRRNGS